MVDAASSIALLLPIVMILLLVITQVSQYFVLKQQLAYVARQAAKEAAYAYGKLGYTGINSGGAVSGPANSADANYLQIVDHISVPGVINPNSPTQFRLYFNIPNAPSLAKSYVTATVTYKSGANLPAFPWNPLQTRFNQIDTGLIRVNSCCAWPIPH